MGCYPWAPWIGHVLTVLAVAVATVLQFKVIPRFGQAGNAIFFFIQELSVQLSGEPLWVEADPSRLGQVIANSLPLIPPPSPAEDGDRHIGEAETGPRLRVLVVEDNTDTALAMSEVLELWGYDVRLAHDGLGALEVSRNYLPEIILLDIGLPVMDGYELARNLRQDPRFKETMLVAITGYGQAEDIHHAHEAGIDHHFTKPIDLEALHALLGRERQQSPVG